MDMEVVKALYESGNTRIVLPSDESGWYDVYTIARYGHGWFRVIRYSFTDTVPFGAYYPIVDRVVRISEVMET